ncbi:hypothetical protein CLOSTMETH_02000 [[Clostridium] methylpentosum DSM 5476]|uniref:Uncharacterized protein n=1 Tax=[Clostridium] methylpentosum DSM 5476 TaxID=537013 RepID=C0EDS2_9FIRM|nr:hypothetical protein CLOSTMETH_02000 [[Clostridium] methylpentosum DSM 5476]
MRWIQLVKKPGLCLHRRPGFSIEGWKNESSIPVFDWTNVKFS